MTILARNLYYAFTLAIKGFAAAGAADDLLDFSGPGASGYLALF